MCYPTFQTENIFYRKSLAKIGLFFSVLFSLEIDIGLELLLTKKFWNHNSTSNFKYIEFLYYFNV